MAASAGLPALLPALDSTALAYLRFHERRYRFLLDRVEQVTLPMSCSRFRILDIGMSFQTALLQEAYPDAVIDTLGYFDHRFAEVVRGAHIHLDLNQVADPAAWPAVEPYDILILAEVIEHLHVAPVYLLRCAWTWMRPGAVLLIQTPNPVSLGKRWSLLRGHNPFEMIREDATNPGHFCEYTPHDLQSLAVRAGFEVVGLWLENYFGQAGAANAVYSLLCSILPGTLRDGITIALRKPSA